MCVYRTVLPGRWDATALAGRWDTTGVRVFNIPSWLEDGILQGSECLTYRLGWKMGYYRGQSV